MAGVSDNYDDFVNFGCEHYKCGCSIIAPCCKKPYGCRLCHNNSELHEINRHAIEELLCNRCDTKQPVSSACSNCQLPFGRYICIPCRLFDYEDKKQFHCDQCGICRVGGKDNFFHCSKCGMCLAVTIKNTHKCLEQASRTLCPVCREDLHSSRNEVHIIKCGHYIHSSCRKDLLKSMNFSCPLCRETMEDLSDYWKMLDEEVAATAMPPEYSNVSVQILCNDCHKDSQVFFHVVGHKCVHCGSYNTCRTFDPPRIPETNP